MKRNASKGALVSPDGEAANMSAHMFSRDGVHNGQKAATRALCLTRGSDQEPASGAAQEASLEPGSPAGSRRHPRRQIALIVARGVTRFRRQARAITISDAQESALAAENRLDVSRETRLSVSDAGHGLTGWKPIPPRRPMETMHETDPREGARGTRADDGRPTPAALRRRFRRDRAQPTQAVSDPPQRVATGRAHHQLLRSTGVLHPGTRVTY